MEDERIIHHYTGISKLALILKNRKIRFNRLDKVDDVSEMDAYDRIIDLSKYLFVSCWTTTSEESIPMWQMYSKEMTGIRITVKNELFNFQPLNPDPKYNYTRRGDVYSPIPFDQIFGDNYMIFPMFLDKRVFEKKICYVENLKEELGQIVNLSPDDTGLNISTDKLAGYKNKEWEFQHEFRFILFIIPSPPIPDGGFGPELFSQLPSHVLQCFRNKIPPDISCFDLEVHHDALNNIEVTMGPLSNDGDRILVEALLEKYTQSGTVGDSKMKGKIRTPLR